MNVYRHRCDGCNREVEPPAPGIRWAADGWLVVDGPYGHGEPYDQYHLCSYDCLVSWGNRQRIRGGDLMVTG